MAQHLTVHDYLHNFGELSIESNHEWLQGQQSFITNGLSTIPPSSPPVEVQSTYSQTHTPSPPSIQVTSTHSETHLSSTSLSVGQSSQRRKTLGMRPHPYIHRSGQMGR